MVYQGIARGIGVDEVYQMNLFATENILPKRTIFFVYLTRGWFEESLCE